MHRIMISLIITSFICFVIPQITSQNVSSIDILNKPQDSLIINNCGVGYVKDHKGKCRKIMDD